MRFATALGVVIAAMTTLIWAGTWSDEQVVTQAEREVLPEAALPEPLLASLPTLDESQVTTLDESVEEAREELAEAIVEADVVKEEPYVPAAPTEVVAVRVTAVPVVGYAAQALAAFQALFAEWAYAYAVSGCETGHTYDPSSIGAQGEVGILQIHPIHFPRYGRPPADIWGQVQHAVAVVRDLGWRAWSCA